MDTDELSKETYRAILVEAELFNHDLTLQFGILSDDCNNEPEFIEKSERLIERLKKANSSVLSNIFFGNVPNMENFIKALDQIKKNINKVKLIPLTKRHFDF